MMKATPESPRMFESDLFDAFSRVPAWVVPLIYVPAISALVAQAYLLDVSILGIVLEFAAGVLGWTLLEYWLHRTLFHWIPEASWGERFHFYLHGVHHTWVNDKLRLVMPPAASLALAAVFWALFYGAGQLGFVTLAISPTWIWASFAGLVAGYLAYDMLHYYVHHFRPRTAMMQRLKAHHLSHHHNPKYQEAKFGVSTTLWDHVFGTY